MTRTESLPAVNGLTLKLIALVTMTIDHTACIFWCGDLYWPMRCIGRIAFPIYCFLLVEGYFHTKNVKNYMGRLLLVGLVSEIPFDLMDSCFVPCFTAQSVMLTLLLGLTAMWLMDHCSAWAQSRISDPVRLQLLNTGAKLAIIVGGVLAGDRLMVDYHGGGVLMILTFYAFRGKRLPLALALAVVMGGCFGRVELFGLLALVPIFLYNGQRGSIPGGKVGQWFFYWYYPLHIGVLVVLAAVLGVQSYEFFA